MADRIEREIEEILAKLDVGGDSDTITGERMPTPISAGRRRSRAAAKPLRPHSPLGQRLNLNPATLLLAGAAVMVAGLIAANWWGPFIWLSFAGVILFIAAFAWSFRRHPAGTATPGGPRRVYWRDRYIDMSPPSTGSRDRVRRIFRRR